MVRVLSLGKWFEGVDILDVAWRRCLAFSNLHSENWEPFLLVMNPCSGCMNLLDILVAGIVAKFNGP